MYEKSLIKFMNYQYAVALPNLYSYFMLGGRWHIIISFKYFKVSYEPKRLSFYCEEFTAAAYIRLLHQVL